jgi:hypothetical protein
VDNVKMDLREIGWDGMDWIDLAKDRDQWRAPVKTVLLFVEGSTERCGQILGTSSTHQNKKKCP